MADAHHVIWSASTFQRNDRSPGNATQCIYLATVQPLTASPGTTANYRNFLGRINQYVGQMTAHIQGVAVASDYADDNENDGGVLETVLGNGVSAYIMWSER
jgi:hypothetical protein